MQLSSHALLLLLLCFTTLFNILGHHRRVRRRASKVRQILLRGSNFSLRFFYVTQIYDMGPTALLQRPLLRMSPTAGDETSRGRNCQIGRRRDFGRRRRHRQSGFQHTYRPRISSPVLFNKAHYDNFTRYRIGSIKNSFLINKQ